LNPMPEAKDGGGKYDDALDLAWGSLSRSDLRDIARASLCGLQEDELDLRHLSTSFRIRPADRTMFEDGAQVQPHLQVLALHYLLGCDDRSLTGRPMSFAQAPGGPVYLEAFKKRVLDRLAEAFGSDPSKMLRAGEVLHGERVPLGDAGIRLLVFPKMPVTAIVWKGDEEIPANASMLFDELTASILPTEDLAVLGSHVLQRLQSTSK